MEDAIEYTIKGIKCDNPKCNWEDNEAEFIPENWLNVPCPECGANLFTQASWDQMKTMQKFIDAINGTAKKLGIVKGDEKRVTIKALHDENGMINGARIVGDDA